MTPRVTLMFPGQGAQHRRMAAGLYRHEPVFTEVLDETLAAYGDQGAMLRALWLNPDPAVSIDATVPAQGLLFAVDYALGRMVLSWGVRPAVLLGHSVGEVVAATIAGVFDPAEICALLVERTKRLADGPAGGMLAVAATPSELACYLDDHIQVGAHNARRQTVLAGPEQALAAVQKQLCADGYVCRPIAAQTPFHSSAIAGLAEETALLFASIRLQPPKIPVLSAYTGHFLSAEEARNPDYWAIQPAEPVLFWPTLQTLLASGDHLLIEAGPSQGLSTAVRTHPSVRAGRTTVFPVLPPRQGRPEADRSAVRAVRAQLANQGLLTTEPV
ncbi:acyltransferase domain-containing protein [Nocardia arthritidis]|nr:acyltransferase domain-containing protein [Nocardia arthritidis]